MKQTTVFLGVIAFAAMIFAGASTALAAPDPLYFKVTVTGKGYLADEDNQTESKANFKTTAYLMWLGDSYALACESDFEISGWSVELHKVEPIDTGSAIYIADEEVPICVPNGFVLMSFTARISYKVQNEAIANAKLATLGAQIINSETEDWGTILGGAQTKGSQIDFEKLPEDVQVIFEEILHT